MKVNVEHLEKIKAHLREVPERLNMGVVVDHLEPGQQTDDGYVAYQRGGRVFEVPACGTVGCIAGWSQLLRGGEEFVRSLALEADFLGVTTRLFFPDKWPEDLYDRYYDAETQQEKVDLVCEAIDRVIAGNGIFTPDLVVNEGR